MEHGPRLDRTALVVDDDVFMVSALAELLEEEGFDVRTASNGFSALRQAVEWRPAVMLLDLALPERSGAELLEDLRAEPTTRNMAIVVVTGRPEALNEAQQAETDGVIAKPFDADELLAAVHRAVQHAATRRTEVAPVVDGSHVVSGVRAHRPGSPRRTRGRR